MYSNTMNSKNWLGVLLLLTRWPYLGYVIFVAVLYLIRLMLRDCSHALESDIIPAINQLIKMFNQDLVCGTNNSNFFLVPYERIAMMLLSSIGIIFNVIPKYIKNDGAQRHIIQAKGNMILLVHIISGIIAVIWNGYIGINGGLRNRDALFWSIASVDLVHQLSIVLLIKNHDGIYALRTGNIALSIFKFTVLINHQKYGASISDLLFVASFGFMGTRLGSLLSYIACISFGYDKGLQFEHWYSVGLSLAQFHIMIRVPNAERIFIWAMPLTSWLFYHELWKRKFKTIFFILNCFYAAIALLYLSSPEAHYVIIIIYWIVTFFLPQFYRWPENALKEWKASLKNKDVNENIKVREPRVVKIDRKFLRQSSMFF